ncbi:MAG: alpha-E domain-containing protein [Bacteroidales bacterium]|nr:alpha-E domain-containing protein [Bacteroidales bacterium]
MEKVISAAKVNNLYWLGRYVERGYLMLHLMRKAYDEVIDVPVGETPYSEFLNRINGYSCSTFTSSYQMMQQIYDANNPTSLRAVIERMMDNAIVLRPDIYSESFSYVELCRDKIALEAEKKQMNIADLQPINDWLLSFWGSVSERLHGPTYYLLCIGRIMERLDIALRFEYKKYRIVESWESLKKYLQLCPDVYDKEQAEVIEQTIDSDYDRFDLIAKLNSLIKA